MWSSAAEEEYLSQEHNIKTTSSVHTFVLYFPLCHYDNKMSYLAKEPLLLVVFFQGPSLLCVLILLSSDEHHPYNPTESEIQYRPVKNYILSKEEGGGGG